MEEMLFNLFTVLKKLKECAGFFFFNNLIATNDRQLTLMRSVGLCERAFALSCMLGISITAKEF